jgi:hypothetical protein
LGQSPGERGMSDKEKPLRPPRRPAPQAKGPDQGGTRAASIRNAPPASQGSPAAGLSPAGGEPLAKQPVPPVVTQNVQQTPAKAPAGGGGGTPTPGSKSKPPAASTPVEPGPSRPAPPQVPAAGSSYHGSAAPGSSPPPTSQAVQKRREGKPSLPGEPANRLAPHRVEGARPKAQKPPADQQAQKP